MNESAIKMQTECNFIFMEIIVMIKGFDCRESGEQWNEQRRYIVEIKVEWGKEKYWFIKYRDYLTETAKRLVGGNTNSQRSSRAECEEQILQWRERPDLDPGPITEEINKLEWRSWQSKFNMYIKGSTEGGKPLEELRPMSLQSKLNAFWHERITQSYDKEMDNIPCRVIFSKLNRTIKMRHPICAAQADLFRV